MAPTQSPALGQGITCGTVEQQKQPRPREKKAPSEKCSRKSMRTVAALKMDLRKIPKIKNVAKK